MREKLIELIKEARDIGDRHCEEMGSCAKCHELGYDIGKCGEILIANHLIANGVTIQPVLTVAEKADVARICMGIEQLCINMARSGTWEAHTRHMECGEIRELAQRYRDMELVYKVLAGHELFAPSLEGE